MCYVALDFDAELKESQESSSKSKQYQLPDNSFITIGNQQFRCPEALFQPSSTGKENELGIHKIILQSILKCDYAVRAELYNNIILSGGNTMFSGFAERLTKELIAVAPPALKIKVVANPERRLSVWIGGSILGSLSTFQAMPISKSEYEEHGGVIVHKKCQ